MRDLKYIKIIIKSFSCPWDLDQNYTLRGLQMNLA